MFGLSYNDVGNLIANANINKWAKYKPVKLNYIDTVTGQFSNGDWLPGATWWKGDGLCGMATQVFTEFGTITNTNSFCYKLTHGLLGWTYDRPTGGAQSPYRLQDLASYYRDAIAPYGDIGATTIHIDNNGNAQIDWDVVDVDSRNLTLADVKVSSGNIEYPLTSFYLGVILYRNNTYHLFTSSSRFSTGQSLSVMMNNVTSLAGTWDLMPFFSLNQVNGQGTFDAGGLFASMADTTPVSVTLTTNGSNYFDIPTGEWNQSGTQVAYSCDVLNETSSNHTYSSIRISIMGGSATGTEIGFVNLTNITVNAHGYRTLTGNITANKSGYNSYWIVISDHTSGSTIRWRSNMVEDYGGM